MLLYLIHGQAIKPLNKREYIMNLNDQLVEAAEAGDLEVVKYLVTKGVDVTNGENHAVQLASQNGHIDMVKYLISQGADINAGGNHVVSLASWGGHLEMVKFLVSQGANVNASDNNALFMAAHGGHSEVVKYLISQGADFTECKNIIDDSFTGDALVQIKELDEGDLYVRYLVTKVENPMNLLCECEDWMKPYILESLSNVI
jgi:ankyrin repeat protein